LEHIKINSPLGEVTYRVYSPHFWQVTWQISQVGSVANLGAILLKCVTASAEMFEVKRVLYVNEHGSSFLIENTSDPQVEHMAVKSFIIKKEWQHSLKNVSINISVILSNKKNNFCKLKNVL
jgi:hypothetical protein